MSRIKKQLEICPPAYMCKGPNRENFVSTGHKCGYCKGTAGSGERKRAAARTCMYPARCVAAAVSWMRL